VLKKNVEQTRILIVDAKPADYLPVLSASDRLAICWQIYRSGSDALESAMAEGAHVCLINTRLPDMTGLELYRILRPRLRVIPVVLVADRYCPDDELAVLSAGTVHFVCKPLEPLFLEKILIVRPADRPAPASLGEKELLDVPQPKETTGAEP